MIIKKEKLTTKCVMKNLILTLVIFCSCFMNKKQDIDSRNLKNLMDISNCQNSFVYLAELNDSGKEVLIKGEKLNLIKTDYQRILKEIRKNYPKIDFSFVSLNKNILNLKINNSVYFTQQLGDTTPTLFKASLIYSLTENNNINGVNIIFEEGDHGGESKIYYREDFSEFKIINCN